MNSNHDFRSYTVDVMFEGLALQLPESYRYITRCECGFIHAWRNRPKRDQMMGGYTGGEERPIALGHHRAAMGQPCVMMKYRRKRNNSLISNQGMRIE